MFDRIERNKTILCLGAGLNIKGIATALNFGVAFKI